MTNDELGAGSRPPLTPDFGKLRERAYSLASHDGCTNGFIETTCREADVDLSEYCEGCLLELIALYVVDLSAFEGLIQQWERRAAIFQQRSENPDDGDDDACRITAAVIREMAGELTALLASLRGTK